LTQPEAPKKGRNKSNFTPIGFSFKGRLMDNEKKISSVESQEAFSSEAVEERPL
jgi:hypothetical protein